MALRVTNFLILKLSVFLFQEMSYSTSLLFLSRILPFILLNPNQILLSLSLFQILPLMFLLILLISLYQNLMSLLQIIMISMMFLLLEGLPILKIISYLHDYQCKLVYSFDSSPPSSSLHQDSGSAIDIARYLSYSKLSSTHQVFTLAIYNHPRAKTYKQAAQNPKWQEAMLTEMTTLENNSTWIITDLPPGNTVIGCVIKTRVLDKEMIFLKLVTLIIQAKQIDIFLLTIIT